jgi:hypothetical protein
MPKPKLLILTGPQGSGNHMFAKIFSADNRVHGWKMAVEEWQGHHEEPFALFWRKPSLLLEQTLKNKFYVTSISCPYFRNKQPQQPNYREFIRCAEKMFNCQLVILGRDKTILKMQQQRLRTSHTTPTFLKHLKQLTASRLPTTFVSQELFFLYGAEYLKSLSTQTGFPINHKNKQFVKQFLDFESNKKYIKNAEKGYFDDQAKKASYKDS